MLLGLLALAAALWQLSRSVDGLGRPTPIVLFALPALGVLQLALGRSVAPARTVDAVMITAALTCALAFVLDRCADPRAATRLALVAVCVGLAQAAFAVYSWSFAPTRIYGVARPDVTMPFGSFVNHNHFAGFTELLLLVAGGLCIGELRRGGISPRAILAAAATLALGAAHLASRSRGGLLALSAGALVLGASATLSVRAWQGRMTRLRALAVSALAAAALLAFAWWAVSPESRRHLLTILSGTRDVSAAYRLDTWNATLRLAASRPLLGSGLGAYEDAVPRYKSRHGEVRSTHAENDVVEFLAEAGVAGVSIVLWLGVWWARRVRSRLDPRRDPLRAGITAGALGGAAALLAHSLIDFNLRIPSNALVFAVLLGLAAADRRDAAPVPVSHRRAAVSAALVMLLAFACFWRAVGARSLDQALRIDDSNARLQALESTVTFHPYLAEAWRARALAWRTLADGKSPFRSRRLERAVEDLSVCLRLRPQWADAWADRGWIRGMLGDLDAAGRDLDRARELDPTHSGIRLLGEALRAPALRK